MGTLFFSLWSATSVTSETTSSSSSGGSSNQKLTEALKSIVKSPWLYVVLGVLVLLIICFYLYRRIIHGKAGVVSVVVKGGSIYKLIDEKTPKYFVRPFVEKVGAVISLKEKEFSSDKLFINNGPDALYKINYTLKYKVIDVKAFYPHNESFQNLIAGKLNDELREYADQGHALELVKDYREHADSILSIINGVTKEYGVEAISFKVNFIEPLGRK